MKRHCLTLFFFGIFLSVDAIDFSRINVAWQYDPNAEITLAHRVYQRDGDVFVLLKVTADSLARWSFDFLVQDGYESESHDKIELVSADTLGMGANEMDLKLRLPVTSKDLMVIKVFRFEQFYYYDIGLKVGTLPFPSIYPVDDSGLPIYTNYINRSAHSWSANEQVHVIKYVEDFAKADAPMADMRPIAPTARQDSAFVSGVTPSLEEKYFYVIRSDSNQSSGVTVLRVPPYFPEYRKLTELVESMLYLTSEAEEKALLKSIDLKKDFDGFWINNLNTKPRARNGIRKYYSSIRLVNSLFTDFKPGWKTDRGMMYLIYGMPDEVYRLNGLEEWYYDSGEAFEFNVISSFFAPRTYSLRRNRDFEDVWFMKISEIRRGIR